ncbi:MAG: Rieske 2Fe-2S domain-containing protein [Gammaproteobacteria bacterium]|nr:Rieske 2Fe-2S domain-containing protein [Gammaproteobacteria bacterium]
MTNPDLKVVADSDPVMGLDARYFTDRELYRRIVDQVFYKNWLLACHSSQVGKPGDYLTLEIYDQDILVTHDRDGAIRAFYNVCQHRGHKLASGSGNKKLLVCPYHAWSYDLRGQLKAAPHANKVPGFDSSKICLTEIRLENFLGFLFINLDPDAAGMDQTYPGIRDEMFKLCPDVEQRKYAYHHTADEGCNWFVAVENYNECYHCSNCHPSFAKGIIEGAASYVQAHAQRRGLVRHQRRGLRQLFPVAGNIDTVLPRGSGQQLHLAAARGRRRARVSQFLLQQRRSR